MARPLRSPIVSAAIQPATVIKTESQAAAVNAVSPRQMPTGVGIRPELLLLWLQSLSPLLT